MKVVIAEKPSVARDIAKVLNITDKKKREQAEKELSAEKNKLEAATAAIGSIAHEVRTPLAAASQGVQRMGDSDVWNTLVETYQMANEEFL